jgi:hypothetical protein
MVLQIDYVGFFFKMEGFVMSSFYCFVLCTYGALPSSLINFHHFALEMPWFWLYPCL